MYCNYGGFGAIAAAAIKTAGDRGKIDALFSAARSTVSKPVI